MARTSRSRRPMHPAAVRLQRLMDTYFGGSRSALAAAARVPLTNIVKVVTGQQAPGRQLLETITKNTDANPTWLLTGEGPPLRSSAIPVARELLPGAPGNHTELLGPERVE